METDPDGVIDEAPERGTPDPETDAPAAPEEDDGGGDAGVEDAPGGG